MKTANGFAFPAQVLLYGSSKKPLARAVRDVVHPDMWRLVLPDGRTSGPANLTRIKDTGLVIAERGPLEAPGMMYHMNAIQSWGVAADGSVKNVHSLG